MKNRIDEHDMTKKMMDIMRGGYKGLLNEVDDAQTQFDQSSNEVSPTDLDQQQEEPLPSDTIELKQGDAAFNNELTTMRETVNGTIEFTSFNIYPNDRNVVIDGNMEKSEGDNSGVFFKMALTASDIDTSMVDVELDDELNESLKRLTGYFFKFKDEWGPKVRTEYKAKTE